MIEVGLGKTNAHWQLGLGGQSVTLYPILEGSIPTLMKNVVGYCRAGSDRRRKSGQEERGDNVSFHGTDEGVVENEWRVVARRVRRRWDIIYNFSTAIMSV